MGSFIPNTICNLFGFFCSQQYNIALVNMGEDRRYSRLFARAARRWEQVIVGDLSPVRNPVVDLFLGFFPGRSLIVPVDDMVIGYEVVDLFGDFFLGETRPIRTRFDGTPYSAAIRIDRSFLEGNSDATNYAIILKEMGHALGIGTLWFGCAGGCIIGTPLIPFNYNCANGLAAYEGLNLRRPNGDPARLRIASGLGGGLCRNFLDSSFPVAPGQSQWSELMTPGIEAGVPQLITAATVASFLDISAAYQVDLSAADSIPSLRGGIFFGGVVADRTVQFPNRAQPVPPVQDSAP